MMDQDVKAQLKQREQDLRAAAERHQTEDAALAETLTARADRIKADLAAADEPSEAVAVAAPRIETTVSPAKAKAAK